MRTIVRHIVALAFLFAATQVSNTQAQEDLVTDLSRHLISIQSNFTGAELLLFGTIGAAEIGNRDIVIVVRGPDTPITVRQKERIGGIWINYGSAEFESVPGYYAVISSRPLDEIAPASVLERYGIGLENLGLQSPEKDAGQDVSAYLEATNRIRSAGGLFREQPGDVLFLGSSLFRASIEMPANVPDGLYTARVYLFSDGNVLQAQSSNLFVNKVGFERLVYEVAHNRPFAYGIAAVLIALIAGWIPSVLFRGR